jgi:hypothetical protein
MYGSSIVLLHSANAQHQTVACTVLLFLRTDYTVNTELIARKLCA